MTVALRVHNLLAALTALLTSAASAQPSVPVHTLSAAEVTSSGHFGNIFGVRQLAAGHVLVNDGIRRQLVMLDPQLSSPRVVLDSVADGGDSYGPRGAPMIPYLADSTLFVDGPSLSLLVIDPFGKVSRVMSAPRPGDIRFLAGGSSGVDASGHLIYRGLQSAPPTKALGTATPGASVLVAPDSAPIVRANLDRRTVDTIGRVKIQNGTRMITIKADDGRVQTRAIVNPLSTVDDWAVLSDGTIAFVRGHDYHVDVIRPDGATVSGGKLPFDWKRLSDADKAGLIDSARNADAEAAAARANDHGGAIAAAAEMDRLATAFGKPGGGGGVAIAKGDGSGKAGGATAVSATIFDYVPISEIADYYPPIRPGATKADLDGNLWILPTTSSGSRTGELLYDVVDNRGELSQRVRLPMGRSIAGFGRDGVVFLMHRDGTAGWILERTKIVKASVP